MYSFFSPETVSCPTQNTNCCFYSSPPLHMYRGFDLSHTWLALVVFPSFFSLTLNFVMRSWWSELSHSQLQVLFLLSVNSFSIFSHKECNWFDFGIDHLVMFMCKIVSCAVEKLCLLWPVHSLGRIQLVSAPFPFVHQGQTCLFQVSLDFLLLCFNPQWWIEHLFLVLVLLGCLYFHRTG